VSLVKFQIAIYGLSIAVLTSSCSDQAFNSSSKLHQTKEGSLGVTNDRQQEPAVDRLEDASEPVMVGGSFLGCFIDHSLVSASETDITLWPFGCAVFADSEFQMRHLASEFEISKASLKSADGRTSDLLLTPQTQHPRWTWIGYLPADSGPYDLSLTITGTSPPNNHETLSLQVSDVLPPSLLGLGLVANAEFKFRYSATELCLSGNPVWQSTPEGFLKDQLRLVPCREAVSFRFAPWLDGYRVHTANPTQPACDPRWYPADFCNRSCADLADFGRGDDFELFACTYSQEAQLLRFQEADDLTVKIQVNGRNMTIDEGEAEAAEANDPLANFELLTSPTLSDL